MAKQVNTIVTMLPAGSHVLECYKGEDGIFRFVDMWQLCAPLGRLSNGPYITLGDCVQICMGNAIANFSNRRVILNMCNREMSIQWH